jgi:DNA-binding PucR family transcriptional regulator
VTASTRKSRSRRLERATGDLASAAVAQMDETLPWFGQLPAAERSWVGLVAQAGVAAFVAWYLAPSKHQKITADVFGTAPRELVRAISLAQTVDLVRTTVEVVEANVAALAEPGEEAELRESILRYSREIAFAAAEVYARAAEERGAWDARLEALVIDTLVRADEDEDITSRAAALGWSTATTLAAIVGTAPDGDRESAVESFRRTARHGHVNLLAGIHGQILVAVVGGATELQLRALAPRFGPGPVVVGPTVQGLSHAGESTREALAGLRAAVGWPDAPRPVLADALLPERALLGELAARSRLVADVYDCLLTADPVLVETLSAFLERSASLEAAARLLFVHPNTIRYRLRRITDLTGYSPTDPRGGWTLRVGLGLGRLGL